MGCYYCGKKNDTKSFCPYSGTVSHQIKVLSTKCQMVIRNPLSGKLTPALKKKSIRMNLGEYCLAANLFLEEMDHGCPLITGYDYRNKQISSIPWERVNEASFGTYELQGIIFIPAYFPVIGFPPKNIDSSNKKKRFRGGKTW